MKTILNPFFVFLICMITSYTCLAQETIQVLSTDVPKNYDRSTDEVVVKPINSIVKVSTTNGVITYAIVNDAVKNELYYNQEKRDALTALPGFVELGLSTDNTPMRVLIETKYADEYLNKYFRVTPTTNTNN